MEGNQQISFTLTTVRDRSSGVKCHQLFLKMNFTVLTNCGGGVNFSQHFLGNYWMGWDQICCCYLLCEKREGAEKYTWLERKGNCYAP